MAKKKKFDHQYIYNEYIKKERSTFNIAKELGTYANTIRRILIKNGVTIRSHSQAQKNQIAQNGHPMTGKKRTKAEKRKISDGMRKRWDDMSEKDRNAESKRRSEFAKAQWEDMSPEDQKAMLTNMHKANYKTIRSGSKNENKIAELLIEAGYKVAQRTNDYTPGGQFEIDICLPNDAIAIEIDGKTHYSPIYGDDRLAKVKATDDMKNRVLLSRGFTVIRAQDKTSKHSLAACTRTLDRIVAIINDKSKHKKLHIIDLK